MRYISSILHILVYSQLKYFFNVMAHLKVAYTNEVVGQYGNVLKWNFKINVGIPILYIYVITETTCIYNIRAFRNVEYLVQSLKTTAVKHQMPCNQMHEIHNKMANPCFISIITLTIYD